MFWPLISNPNYWRNFFPNVYLGGAVGTITGVVYSDPITTASGAWVSLLGGPGMASASDGSFSFDGVPNGTWVISARSASGSQEVSQTITVTVGENTHVILILDGSEAADSLPEGSLIHYLASDASTVQTEDGLSVLDGTATSTPSISDPALAGTARVKTWVNLSNPGTYDMIFATNTQVPVNFAKGWAYYQTDGGGPALHWKPVWDTKGDAGGDLTNVMTNLTAGALFIVARAEQIHDRLGLGLNSGDPLLVQTYGGYSGLVQSYKTGQTHAVNFFTINQTGTENGIATTTDTDSYHLWSIIKGASTWEVRMDGVSLGTVPRPSTSGLRTIQIGEPASALYSYVKELVYYDTALTSEQITAAEEYLMQTYGL